MEALLALDCGTLWTGCALMVDGKILAEAHGLLGRNQAATLPSFVERTLATANFNLSDVTHVAVTCGPGYFTSVRVGMAYGAALAWARGLKVIQVSNLQVLAESFARKDELVVPLIPASRTQLYSAVYANGNLLMSEAERTLEQLEKDLATNGFHNSIRIAAEDDRLCCDPLRDNVTVVTRPLASSLASIGWRQREQACLPTETQAHYLREPNLGRS